MKICFYSSILFITSFSWAISSIQSDAIIQKTHGIVQKSLDQQNWIKTEINDKIQENTYLKTEQDSFCEVQLDQNNLFRIKESTLIQVKHLWDQEILKGKNVVKLIQINLIDGQISSQLDDLPDDTQFEVHSPVSIAGAKGTGFDVIYHSKNPTTQIAVYESSVSVQSLLSPTQKTMLNQYQQMDIAPWNQSVIIEDGTGVLSTSILGSDFINKKQSQRTIEVHAKNINSEEARLNALAQLSSILLNLHIKNDLSFGDFLIQNYEVSVPFYQFIENIEGQFDKATQEYSIQLDLQEIEKLIKQEFEQIFRPIQQISLNEYSQLFGAKARVTTQRAAKIDAYRKLAESIFGVIINAETTVQDFAVSNDSITTQVNGIVRGAQLLNTFYYSDGSVLVQMKINGQMIPSTLQSTCGNVFGETYMSRAKAMSLDKITSYRN